MSYNYYNLDGILTQLKKDRDLCSAKLEKWNEVTFPTRKDGSPFKLMSKNISGAIYFQEEHAMQPGEYYLRVNGWCNGSGYFSDTIHAHELVKYLKDEEMLSKTQNFQPKQTYLEQVYTFDLDDIKKAVEQHISQLKTAIVNYDAQIAAAQVAFNDFKHAYSLALQQLEAAAGARSDLYYYVKDTVQTRYPYI